MTEFRIEVVRIGAIQKHPNADTLSITHVHGGYPCIMRTGDFKEGDLAVYVPVDAVVPTDKPRFSFLGEHARIRAKRLRGIFSMGLLSPVEEGWELGKDVAETLGIVKYEPPEDAEAGADDERDPGYMPVYDVEGFRRYPDAFLDGEEVVVTEKLHGENGRFVHDGERLWCGSRTRYKKRPEPGKSGGRWWTGAMAINLEERLAQVPNIGFYGETHGYTKGFTYGVPKGLVGIRFFDAIDVKTRMYLDVEAFTHLCETLKLAMVPVLARGRWGSDITMPHVKDLAEGPSTLDATHVREGVVLRPVQERRDDRFGRVICKLHGEGFLTAK